MATSTNPMIDNRLIATAMAGQVITVGNTSNTPTIDIPCIGHDAQTNISIDDASGIVITAVVVNPLGLYVVLDISAAVAGTYDIVLISGGRDSTELSYPQCSIVITGAPGGVTYLFPFDITALGKIFGELPVSTTAPSAGQVPTWNGSAWAPATPSAFTPRAIKTVTHADFTTVVAGPGGQYQLLWDNVLYDAYDLAIDVSGSGDATGVYRVLLPNMTVKPDGYVSVHGIYMKNKLPGQSVNVRTFNSANDAYVQGGNTVSGSRPTAHLRLQGRYTLIGLHKESVSNIYIHFIQKEMTAAYNSRTTNISSVTYGNPAGTPYVWGAGNMNTDGESAFAIDVSNQNFSTLGMNRKVLINWRILYTASSGVLWTLDGWLNHSATGEVPGTRRNISCANTNGNAVELEGWCEVDWNQVVNGTLTLYLYRTGATGNFTRGHIVIKEVL